MRPAPSALEERLCLLFLTRMLVLFETLFPEMRAFKVMVVFLFERVITMRVLPLSAIGMV